VKVCGLYIGICLYKYIKIFGVMSKRHALNEYGIGFAPEKNVLLGGLATQPVLQTAGVLGPDNKNVWCSKEEKR
jgi:hypothetical protein